MLWESDRTCIFFVLSYSYPCLVFGPIVPPDAVTSRSILVFVKGKELSIGVDKGNISQIDP